MKLNLNSLKRFKFSAGHVLVCICVTLVFSAIIAIFAKANQTKLENPPESTMMEETILTPPEINVIIVESSPVDTLEETMTLETQPEEPSYEPWNEVPLDIELQEFIEHKAKEKNVNPELIFAMCWRESKYNALDIGDNGQSFGMMQIQPRWHYQTMVDLGCTDLLDPYQNVEVGIYIVSDLIERYDGDISKALVAYNGGSYKGIVTEYATSVINEANRIFTYNPDKH